jgi:hypothetical protein
MASEHAVDITPRGRAPWRAPDRSKPMIRTQQGHDTSPWRPRLPLPRHGTGIEKGVVLRQDIGRGWLARKIWSEVPARRGLAPRPRRHPGRQDVEKRGRPPPGCRERSGRQRGRQGIGLGGNRYRHRRGNCLRLSHSRRPTRRVARVNKRSRQITVARRRGAAPTPVGAREKPWPYGASLESMGAVGEKVQLIYFIK